MTFTEEDLRAALEPLAGDPIEQAARALAALPAAAPARPRWPLAAAACAAGLIVGWGLGLLGESEPPPVIEEVVRERPRGARLEHAIGELEMMTDTGPMLLVDGDTVSYEHFLATHEKSQAALKLPNDVETRVNTNSSFTLTSPRSMTLARGEVWVHVPRSAGTFQLETGEGSIEAAAGTTFTVASWESYARLVVFEGEARFSGLSGDTRTLEAKQAVLSEEAMVGEVAEAELGWAYNSWQLELLLNCGRFEELLPLLYPVVMALDDEARAEQAELELRRAGSIGAMAIGQILYELPADRHDLRRRCWNILCDIATGETVQFLLDGLGSWDPDERARSVQAIERVTGIASEKDEEFWREAAPADRFDVILQWRERLRGF